MVVEQNGKRRTLVLCDDCFDVFAERLELMKQHSTKSILYVKHLFMNSILLSKYLTLTLCSSLSKKTTMLIFSFRRLTLCSSLSKKTTMLIFSFRRNESHHCTPFDLH